MTTFRAEQRRQAARAEILEYAIELVRATGALDVTEVARRAGVSKAAIYYYFDSGASEIILTIAKRFMRETGEALARATSIGDPIGWPLLVLRALLQVYWDDRARHEVLHRLVHTHGEQAPFRSSEEFHAFERLRQARCQFNPAVGVAIDLAAGLVMTHGHLNFGSAAADAERVLQSIEASAFRTRKACPL